MSIIARAVVMVKPTHFAYNEQTAASNAFQNRLSITAKDIANKAMTEFLAMVEKLKMHDIEVIVLPSPKAVTPDAVFPNNWFSTHVINRKHYLLIYPMHHPNRQAEVQIEVLQKALRQYKGCEYIVNDLRSIAAGRALEGTGVFVFDRCNQVAFMAKSERADVDLAQKVAKFLGYELVVFSSQDRNGKAIYHTNVMLAIADRFAMICLDSISDEAEASLVEQKLKKSGKQIINISFDQLYHMGGNMIQLANDQGEKCLLMSKQAEDSLTPEQKAVIDEFNPRLSFDISTIETVGGGSVRCMVAEVF